jgi:hypothetical protein
MGLMFVTSSLSKKNMLNDILIVLISGVAG